LAQLHQRRRYIPRLTTLGAMGDGTSTKSSPVRGYIDGCFDIMHSGHFNAIRQAKGICDVLVVGVHSDSEIEQNKSMPVMRQSERYALLDHVKWIDEILYDVPYSPLISTLERARADFCIHGDDMPINADGVCAYDELRDAGKLRIIKRTEGVSTTDLIGRLFTLARSSCEVPHEIEDARTQHHSSEAISALMRTVESLAAKYQMVTPDKEFLKSHIRAMFQTPIYLSPMRGRKRALSPPSGGEQDLPESSTRNAKERPLTSEMVRTRVPVHLLASTRRISEFASGKQPSPADKIVYVTGSFDMFHVGHAQFLKEARALGTFLFVGIHDDKAISESKGVNHPVMTLNERVLNVCACKWVDEVIIGVPRVVTEDLVKTWNIQVVAKGTGYMRVHTFDAENCFAVPKARGIYKEVPSRWPELCQETVVNRIVRDREIFLKRNRDRAQREDDYYSQKSQNSLPMEV